MFNEYNPLESGRGKIKKILSLVRCPLCNKEFWINQEELKSPLAGAGFVHKAECKFCRNFVKFIRL